jgi:hypothetical protein
MRSQTIHNVIKCRSAHSEVVKEFSLIFSEFPIKSIVGAFKSPCGYYRMLPKFSFGDEANTKDRNSYSTWEPC